MYALKPLYSSAKKIAWRTVAVAGTPCQSTTLCSPQPKNVSESLFHARPTSFSLISHSFWPLTPSETSSETWFSKDSLSLLQDQYVPLLLSMGSLTT